MRARIVIFCAIFAVIDSNSVPFEDCGSLYKIQTVDIEGCYALPCIFKTGSKQNVTLNLISRSTSYNFTHSASLLYPVIHKLQILPSKPCDTIECPFRKDEQKNFTVTLNLPDDLTTRSAELFMTMHNEINEQILCMKTKVVVRN